METCSYNVIYAICLFFFFTVPLSKCNAQKTRKEGRGATTPQRWLVYYIGAGVGWEEFGLTDFCDGPFTRYNIILYCVYILYVYLPVPVYKKIFCARRNRYYLPSSSTGRYIICKVPAADSFIELPPTPPPPPSPPPPKCVRLL